MTLLDWSVGSSDPSKPGDVQPLKTAQIQRQKGITENFGAAVRDLLMVAHEVQQEDEDKQYAFEIKDSTGLLVCQQVVHLNKKILGQLDKQIDEGQL